MPLQRGTIVLSLAGRDKGNFLVTVGYDGKNILVADGKERPLERPKRKNPRHTQKTNTVFPEECIKTDRQLRIALRDWDRSREGVPECPKRT